MLWAYYPRAAVEPSLPVGATRVYTRGEHVLEFHHCQTCGCVAWWISRDPVRQRMGVNARLLAPEVLTAARVRRLDGADTGNTWMSRTSPA